MHKSLSGNCKGEELMKTRQVILLRVSLFCAVVAALLASTLFVSSANKTPITVITPDELDVRVAGGVLRGGQTGASAEGQAPRQASLTISRAPDSAQLKALSSLEKAAGSKLSVEYNQLTGTPRHIFATAGYLTPASAAPPEKIALDFISHWQGVFGFSERDVANLKLKSRATLPDLGTTILLYEQQIDGVPVYKGEVLVNVNRAGQVINVGGDSFPQLTVTNSAALAPAQAVVAAAASLGFENFAPQLLGAKRVPTTFGNPRRESVEAPRFSGGGTFSEDIVVTEVIFPMGRQGRRAYNFVLTTPQYRGIMWNNIVDAETGQVLRRTSLTAFQQGGGPVNSRRSTFRPDVQNLVESNNSGGSASGKVFDGMPTTLSGRRTCTGNLQGVPC